MQAQASKAIQKPLKQILTKRLMLWMEGKCFHVKNSIGQNIKIDMGLNVMIVSCALIYNLELNLGL